MKSIKLFFKGFYHGGIKSFGNIIISFVNFILLVPVYLLGIGATSIIAKISGKHFLNLKKTKKNSYWEPKKQKPVNIDDYYNQY